MIEHYVLVQNEFPGWISALHGVGNWAKFILEDLKKHDILAK